MGLSACTPYRESRFGGGRLRVAEHAGLEPAHVRRFFAEQATLHSKPAGAGSVVSSLRDLSVDLDLRTHGAGAYRSLRRAGGDGVSIRSQGVADIREHSVSRLSVAGNHTSVPHILKVLNPLFLDDLRKP